MTDFEAAQGYVNCGDSYAVTDIEGTPGLSDALERISEQLRPAEGITYTTSELFDIFVRKAVGHLDVLVPVTSEDQRRVA